MWIHNLINLNDYLHLMNYSEILFNSLKRF